MARSASTMEKLDCQGEVLSVQPRIRLLRSFDQRSHSYLGYALMLRGRINGQDREFSVGIGKAAQTKHLFQVGDMVKGRASPVMDPRMEPVELYKASGLKVVKRTDFVEQEPPPWHGPPPELEIYRERGHRRLDPRTYSAKCLSCIWGCRMPVEMIIDQWKPNQKKYRFETFCYGPKACSYYRAGPVRTVPGRKGMSWREEDWVDEDATSHRGMND